MINRLSVEDLLSYYIVMKKITNFHVIGKKEWVKSALLLLQSDEILPEITPGQFVQVRVDNASHTYLRRPISIYDVDYKQRTISLLVQMVGEGTEKIGASKTGDTLNVIYPLGKGFTLPENNDEKVLLVGGGIGIAPLFYLGKMMIQQGIRPVFLIGAKSEDDLILVEQFAEIGQLYLTTDDGSWGEKGFVSQHSIWRNREFDRIYVCGPRPMMKTVAKMAKERAVWCEVSLENMMACGIGACLCCVENTVKGNVCVCKEGPVFNINRLLW